VATVSKFSRGAVAGNGWTSPANATADDGVYSTAAPAKNGTVTGDWDFVAFSDAEIPVGSTINSVTIETQWKVSTTSSVATFGVRGVLNGTAEGEWMDTTEPTADKITTMTFDGVIPTEANLKTAGNVVVRARGTRGNSTTAVTFSLDYVKITVDFTAPAPHRLYCSVTEFEIPAQSRRMLLSVTEFETPTVPHRLLASITELETPSSATRALRASIAELEAPLASRRCRMSAVEFETPTPPRILQASAIELEAPSLSTNRALFASVAELAVPTAPHQLRISFAEVEVGIAPRRMVVSLMEFETTFGTPEYVSLLALRGAS
jgi:hypothetical protein